MPLQRISSWVLICMVLTFTAVAANEASNLRNNLAGHQTLPSDGYVLVFTCFTSDL